MFTGKVLNQTQRGEEEWLGEVKKNTDNPEEEKRFSTASGMEIKPLYTPEDIKDLDFAAGIGYPGVYPFTRSCQATGYRGKVWTFRMFSGFGSAEDTNKRWHQLLDQGETGLSTAFDYPTLMGYDSDSPRATAECGKCGVAIDTLADFEVLTSGIPLDKVTISMTINPPASVLWAMCLVAAEKQGVGWKKVGGTIQNDMLKEFIALRTQQIIAEETGVVNTIDPLAGSYFIEALTNEMEEKAWEYIEKIDKMGGMLAAIDHGFPQIEIANAAYNFQQQVDNNEKIVVGVNKHVTEEAPIELLKINEKVEVEQINRLREKGINNVTVIGGGTIPREDIAKLKEVGIKEVFLPGTPLREIIKWTKENVKPLQQA